MSARYSTSRRRFLKSTGIALGAAALPMAGTRSPRAQTLPLDGNAPVLGRELDLASLLKFIKRMRIRNVVWITADVHYCAAHHYDPRRAQFKDFDPFWEFVAGPLNAGSFGPNALDDTFGPEVVFQKAPPAANYSPFAGFQFFGQIDIDRRSAAMSVRLKDIGGNTVFRQELEPRDSHGRGRSHD